MLSLVTYLCVSSHTEQVAILSEPITERESLTTSLESHMIVRFGRDALSAGRLNAAYLSRVVAPAVTDVRGGAKTFIATLTTSCDEAGRFHSPIVQRRIPGSAPDAKSEEHAPQQLRT